MKRIFKVQINSGIQRALIAIAAAGLVIGACFSAKWGFANTIATRTNVKEISELGADLAPADPLVRYANAGILEKTFDFADIERSLGEYEVAVSLSPYDYRLWLGLGKARERDGDREGAEKAFRKALEFAPHYSRVQWALGNLLVRQGRYDEGFAEIRQAAEADHSFAAPAAAAAWQAMDGDLSGVKAALGDSEVTKIELAKILAGQHRFNDAAAIWTSVAEDKRKTKYGDAAKFLIAKFLVGSQFRYAAAVAAEAGDIQRSAPKIGVINNGGFEDGVKLQNAEPFDWQIGNAVYPQIAMTDGQKKEGKVSLVLLFSDPSNLEWRPVSKLVAVEPGRSYNISFAYRSELKTQAAIRWEAIAASGGESLGLSEPVSSNNEWKTMIFKFAVPAEVDGIALRLVRENCAPGRCTMSGNLWFDDFVLSPGE